MKYKKIIFMLTALMALIPMHPVFSGEVTIDSNVLDKILKRQDALEKEVRLLKKQVKQLGGVPSPAPADVEVLKEDVEEMKTDVEYVKEDVEEMSDRLDTVETKSILDRITIGGELRANMDYFDIDDIVLEGGKKDGSISELWSTRFRLNLRSIITDALRFHGRLTYYKYWGDTNDDDIFWDSAYSSLSNKEGNIHVERAYIDYFIPGTPLAVSIGRLPVSDGPPYELKNNTTRKATWSQLFVDGEFDGIITTLALDEWTGLKDALFRLGYSKIEQNYQTYQGSTRDSMRVGFASFESQIPGIRDSLIWLGAQKQFDFVALDIPGAEVPDDSGTLEQYTLHLQFNNILKSGLSCFGIVSYQDIHPRDEGTVVAPGYEIGLFGDTMHGDLGDDQHSHAFFLGLNYALPLDMLKNPQIGFEYNYGSKYWTPGAITGAEFTTKLNIPGHAYELYYLQPLIQNHLFFRLGTVYQEFDYYNEWGGLFGSMDAESVQSDMTVQHTYFLLDARF